MARRPVGKFDFGMLDRFRLGWRLLRDPRIPAWPKWLVPVGALIYTLSPVDAIPDFIPLLGQLDDVSVIAVTLALIAMLVRWSPPEIVAEHAGSLGLGGQVLHARPEQGPASRAAKQKDEPIEAQYWTDDWR